MFKTICFLVTVVVFGAAALYFTGYIDAQAAISIKGTQAIQDTKNDILGKIHEVTAP